MENNGATPRPLPRAGTRGVGLTTTRARLMTVHGDRASLTLEARPGGGAVVRIVIPLRPTEGEPALDEVAPQDAIA